MLNKPLFLCVYIHLVAVSASLSVRANGWLDRVVTFFKNDFVDDFLKLSHVNIKASIEQAHPGYVDSADWDYPSVVRLLVLLSRSEGNEDVCRALRRSVKPTRRFMSYAESLKAFPSLSKDHVNDFYYDIESVESNETKPEYIHNKSIIHIKNPVEARLPSAHISVKLLRTILENRAKANRYMPSTTRKTTTRTTTTTDKSTKTTTGSESDETTTKNNTDDSAETTKKSNDKSTVTTKKTNDDSAETPENPNDTAEKEAE